jgi:hypothetical protein
MLMCYTKVPKKFYNLRSSFHSETCERPTLSGAGTAPNSETLKADVLSFLTMGKGFFVRVGPVIWTILDLSSVRKNTVRRTGVVQPYLILEEKRN